MAQSTNVKLPPNLCLDTNAATNWKQWLSAFNDYLVVSGQVNGDDVLKLALMRNMMGADAARIVELLPISADKSFDKVIAAITAHYDPKINEVFERFKFRERKQEQNEPFDKFLQDSRSLIKSCNYGEFEEQMMRDHIVQNINDKVAQEALLRIEDLSLEKVIKFCQSKELAQKQVLQMSPVSGSVNIDLVQRDNSSSTSGKIFKCKRCQRSHKPRQCPAFGKTCSKCGFKNHFAISCHTKNKKVQEVNAEESDSSVSEVRTQKQPWFEHIFIENCKIKCKLDTGADVSIMPLKIFNKINKNNLKLLKTNIKLESFEGAKVEPIGMISLNCKYKNISSYENFLIVDCKSVLLGLSGCLSLNLIKRIHSVQTLHDTVKENFIKNNIEVFKGSGQLPGEFDIPTRKITEQICHPSSRIPNAVYEPLQLELDRLEKRKAIVKVENISSKAIINKIVIVERKNKKIRLCLDPSDLNKYIIKKPKVLPTIDELACKLNGKKFFSVLDLSEGFHHLRLKEEASWKCCFATPFGVYRYLVLPYGLMNAPELFQDVLESHFSDIKNVIVWADDILVTGNDSAEHDLALKNVINKAKKLGIVFNKDKLQYKQKQVKYVGQIFSENGMSIDTDRVESLLKLKSPKDKNQLKQIIGSFSYIRRYVPSMAEFMSPLSKLLRKDVEFNWLPIHEKALNMLKQKASEAPCLSSFDPKKKIVLQCDASKNGLACCMFQLDNSVLKLVACASRTMSDCEINYGQTEKEFLAIAFGCKKFHKYIYGTQVDVQTDHKPIVSIMSKHVNKLGSPRLKRIRLKLFMYDLNVYYVPGKLVHFADMLSRNSLSVIEQDTEMLQMVHTVSKYLPMSPEMKNQFKNATSNDKICEKLSNYYLNGWPRNISKDCLVYSKFKDSIYMQDGLLFVEDRILVPESLRSYVLSVIHKGHCGIVKSINRAKKLFYWPQMRADIHKFVQQCRTCEKYSPTNFNESLLPHKIPKERFLKVGVDILDYNGSSFLVIVDYFSHWLELLPLKDKTSECVIDAMQNVFSRFGYPLELISDNMPFSSFKCQSYFKSKDITLITSTPRYPKSNGMAEKYVQISKMILKKYFEDNLDYREGIMQYNNTPLVGLNLSPSQILNSRNIRTSPCTIEYLKPKIQKHVYKLLLLKQSVCKNNYDRHARRNNITFEPGDEVVYREGNVWLKAKIDKKHKQPRSYIILTSSGKHLRRNNFQLKKSLSKPNSNDQLGNTNPIENYIEPDIDPTCLPNIPFNNNSNVTLNSGTNVLDQNVESGQSGNANALYMTRSGRMVKPPQVLDL